TKESDLHTFAPSSRSRRDDRKVARLGVASDGSRNFVRPARDAGNQAGKSIAKDRSLTFAAQLDGVRGREAIFARVREALKVTAPFPGADAPQQLASPRQWLPPVGKTSDEQVALFGQNARALKADFHICEDLTAAVQVVKSLAANEGWKKIGVHDGALTNAVASALALPTVKTDGGYALDALEACDAGLTECDALIAQTGTVLVSGRSSGGRALSILPPHHVVLARRNQILPDLTAALQRAQEKFGAEFPGVLSLITGPSRTGDIERILVLGAHGPKRLTILLTG
ncbi:MAG TPA: lactate utilization protein, partial [Verrucomicrobiae bacterium]|nr:lactate utilization protein [Verrucomicrobiae bacterium]